MASSKDLLAGEGGNDIEGLDLLNNIAARSPGELQPGWEVETLPLNFL